MHAAWATYTGFFYTDFLNLTKCALEEYYPKQKRLIELDFDYYFFIFKQKRGLTGLSTFASCPTSLILIISLIIQLEITRSQFLLGLTKTSKLCLKHETESNGLRTTSNKALG